MKISEFSVFVEKHDTSLNAITKIFFFCISRFSFTLHLIKRNNVVSILKIQIHKYANIVKNGFNNLQWLKKNKCVLTYFPFSNGFDMSFSN